MMEQPSTIGQQGAKKPEKGTAGGVVVLEHHSNLAPRMRVARPHFTLNLTAI